MKLIDAVNRYTRAFDIEYPGVLERAVAETNLRNVRGMMWGYPNGHIVTKQYAAGVIELARRRIAALTQANEMMRSIL